MKIFHCAILNEKEQSGRDGNYDAQNKSGGCCWWRSSLFLHSIVDRWFIQFEVDTSIVFFSLWKELFQGKEYRVSFSFSSSSQSPSSTSWGNIRFANQFTFHVTTPNLSRTWSGAQMQLFPLQYFLLISSNLMPLLLFSLSFLTSSFLSVHHLLLPFKPFAHYWRHYKQNWGTSDSST